MTILVAPPRVLPETVDAAMADDAQPTRTVRTSSAAATAQPDYVGSGVCAKCHAEEHAAWTGSDHHAAMQPATTRTVLGNFNHQRFTYAGSTSRFFVRDGRHFARTDGADGKLAEFEISRTFGVYPLQQYLIPFPDGRYQALGIAWDARPRATGGQRWFHLYPEGNIDHNHPLHWTQPEQNWNNMCAGCHSTGLQKNYSAEGDSYTTGFAEINVSCEACHGQGSRHVHWAEHGRTGKDPHRGLVARLGDSNSGEWLRDETTGNARRSTPLGSRVQVETCGRCHSRRAVLREDFVPGRPLLDTHALSLLDADLYYPDGQIKAEVFEYGSFVQSRMYATGVVCSDCHEPHTLKLRAAGDAVCSRCHEDSKYRRRAHHFHDPGSTGTNCIACHMLAKNYMVIDERHDHSFRVPRPDLSRKLGTPNTCSSCHTEKSVQWAAEAFADRYPQRIATAHYGEVIHAAQTGTADAGDRLPRLIADTAVPAIVRATAVSLLPDYFRPESPRLLAQCLADPDPLLRLATLQALTSLSPRLGLQLAPYALRDGIRAVRIEAARVLAGTPPEALGDPLQSALDTAIGEYVDAQQANADRAFAHTNLGILFARRGKSAQAEAAYRKAIALEPKFVQAQVNLADLYRQQGRDAEGEALLHRARTAVPGAAAVHHALGLLEIRRGAMDKALPMLERAAQLGPDTPRFAYVYAVALHDVGRIEDAIGVLAAAHDRRRADRAVLGTLLQYQRERGDLQGATRSAERLAQLLPWDTEITEQLSDLRRQLQGTTEPRSQFP